MNIIKSIEYVIVGLGNPGDRYINTRHNVGFMTIDKICNQFGVILNTNKFNSMCGQAVISDRKIFLAKPQTYMNESGKAVQEIVSFYKVPLDHVIIIFDDVSLEVGKIRLKRCGSDGGHNGIKSIINCCGSEKIPRIKVGVGSKPSINWDLADWVLSKFSDEEMLKIHESISNVINSVELTLKYSMEYAMNKFN